MNGILWAMLVSMMPIAELQGGIPIALAAGYPPWLALLACVAANILVVPILFFFLEVIHKRLLHVNSYQSLFDKFMERTRKKTQPLVEKYGVTGLIILVALPGPGTGAYTATLAAWFFNVDKKYAFFAISLGMLAAGIIILSASLGVMKFFSII